MTPEYDDRCLLRMGQDRGVRGIRPGLLILDRRPLPPFRHRLGVDPKLPAQRRERSLRSLYCCSDGVRGRGGPVTYLSHMASFHSKERIAPSNRGIKHLDTLPPPHYVMAHPWENRVHRPGLQRATAAQPGRSPRHVTRCRGERRSIPARRRSAA